MTASGAAVLVAYRELVRILRQRGSGASLPGVADWVRPELIDALSLPLGNGRGHEPVVEVSVRDGYAGCCVPQHWPAAGGARSLRLRPVRAARPVAQGAPGVSPDRYAGTVGTATALLRDRLAPHRNYLLTCGHVVAPDAMAQLDDRSLIGPLASGQTVEGRLAEWLPSIGSAIYSTALDAALVEVGRNECVSLQREPDWLPAGVGGDALLDMRVSVRRRAGPLSGELKTNWSGYVDLPGVTPGQADYFLAGAVGYASSAPTLGGDSGAALWDADERLMGLHLGAIPGAAPGSVNAVMGPIAPVLDWFSVQPYTRGDPASLPAPGALRTAPAPRTDPPPDDEAVSIVARTIWGEARGEGERGMRAVACVIANRVNIRRGGLDNPAAICLARKQFSCWNADDPNLGLLERAMREPDAAYMTAAALARSVVARDLGDITGGATHYFATTLRRRPPWALGHEPCARIGNHEFYTGID